MVLASGLVGISMSYDGISGHLIGVVAAPYYFASTENGWTTHLLEHIPHWQVPTNASGEMTRFYEGGKGTFPLARMGRTDILVDVFFGRDGICGIQRGGKFCENNGWITSGWHIRL